MIIEGLSYIKYVFKLTEINVCVKADKEKKVKRKVFESLYVNVLITILNNANLDYW